MRGGKNFIDLTGQRFGRWIVVGRCDEPYFYKDGKTRVQWVCKCDCGLTKRVLGCALKCGTSKSCGCLQKEQLSKQTWRGYKDISGVYWNQLRSDAKKRSLEWEIDVQFAWDLFEKQRRLCSLSKLPLHFERNYKHNGINQTASLDRINSKRGYTYENIQWLHKDINKLKWDWDLDHFYSLCELIVQNKSQLGFGPT